MEFKVLVLDQSYQPIKVITWMRAITLVLSGKAELIEDGDIFNIRSADKTFELRSIIRIFTSVVNKKINFVPFTRHNIFLRDQWTCQYCGIRNRTSELNWDHVIPRSRGGPTSWENIVTACYPCNTRKADRLPEEADMRLLSKPQKPKNVSVLLIKLKSSNSVPSSWKIYLDPKSFAYWHLQLQEDP